MFLSVGRESLSGQKIWRRNQRNWILVIQLVCTILEAEAYVGLLYDPNTEEQSAESETEFIEVRNCAL